MRFNKEELLIGAIYPLLLIPISTLTMLACPISAFLWAYSGAGASKLYRRLAIPALIALIIYLVDHNVRVFYAVPISFAALTLGYGIPDSTDEGSFLGRIFYKLANKHELVANILTRGTIIGLSVAPFYFLNG